jgi:hypothetical protein
MASSASASRIAIWLSSGTYREKYNASVIESSSPKK